MLRHGTRCSSKVLSHPSGVEPTWCQTDGAAAALCQQDRGSVARWPSNTDTHPLRTGAKVHRHLSGDHETRNTRGPPSTQMPYFSFLFLFGATPMVYGSSQARGQIGVSAKAYTTAYSNTRSLTHWARINHIFMDTSQVLNLLSHKRNSPRSHLERRKE